MLYILGNEKHAGRILVYSEEPLRLHDSCFLSPHRLIHLGSGAVSEPITFFPFLFFPSLFSCLLDLFYFFGFF